MMKKIDIGTEYYKSPAGRNAQQHDFNGEKFRNEYLKPALLNGDTVILSLQNVSSLNPSFFEEAIGGLYRDDLDHELKITLDKQIKFTNVSGTQYRSERWAAILGYIENARERFLTSQ